MSAGRWRASARVRLGEHELTVDPSSAPSWCRSPGTRALTSALRALDADTVPIEDISLRRPSLDDVFLELTDRIAEDDDVDQRRGAGTTAAPLQGRRD
jgi:ABC-2 type transport system ATP-binding protein